MSEHKYVTHKTYTGSGCAMCGKSEVEHGQPAEVNYRDGVTEWVPAAQIYGPEGFGEGTGANMPPAPDWADKEAREWLAQEQKRIPGGPCSYFGVENVINMLTRFANKAVERQREEDAKLVKNWPAEDWHMARYGLAAAIQKGEK